MTCADCRNVTKDSNVKVAEGARSAVFKNLKKAAYHRVRVDGCLIKNKTAADFMVSCPGVGSVVVELKGTDVEHAVDQIDATLEHVKGCEKLKELRPFAGLVVCARYPRFDTGLQRLTKKFVAKHKVPIHVVAKNDEFDLEKVLKFDGPK
ncbi:hypothetical protein [Pseudoxanthomonas sp. PXM01]|uniref:hypothetical protein n=1 Tax=Pseudoxanthomonas sp. PXM01 TaxID=2769295 RepID=UPI0017867018|nr:hypothetical protein [Pseudoxanthomonas sp. PXM01]MBD9468002.1 hypothetical protein [Pseudoxanthomonas sp. PXM01]